MNGIVQRFVQTHHTRDLMKERDLYMCMDEWNRPVRRQLSLTQAVWDKLIPTGLVLVIGMKACTRCILTVLCVPSIMRPLKSVDA